jgi:PAS domain-containing protein
MAYEPPGGAAYERVGEPVPDRLRDAHDALVSTGIGAWTWRPALDRFEWSAEAAALLDVPTDALPSSTEDLLSLVEPADREVVRRALAGPATEHPGIVAEFRLGWPDGQPRWLLLRGRAEAAPTAETLLVHGIVADISVRRRADETLRFNEERYRTLVYASADVIWTMAGDGGHQVEVRLLGLDDRTWCAFTGQDPARLPTETWLAAVHPDDRARAGHAWQSALARGDEFEVEYRLQRWDGA